MPLSSITENAPAFAYVKSEGPGTRSVETLTIDQNQTLKAGTILGQVSIGALAVAAAAAAGNAGNGALGAWTAAAGTPLGVYKADLVEGAANAGTFRLEGPDGVEVGEIKVGVAFNAGGLAGTIGDGAVDWAAGDGFTLTVTDAPPANAGNYVALNPAATDGSQNFAAIAGRHLTTGPGETARLLGHVRDCEVWASRLDYGSLNAGQIDAVNAQMAEKGVVVR